MPKIKETRCEVTVKKSRKKTYLFRFRLLMLLKNQSQLKKEENGKKRGNKSRSKLQIEAKEQKDGIWLDDLLCHAGKNFLIDFLFPLKFKEIDVDCRRGYFPRSLI